MAMAMGLSPFVLAENDLFSSLLPEMFVDFSINEQIALYFMAIVLGSILPDVDEVQSSIGKRTRILSDLFSFAFGHRTITHWFVTRIIMMITAVMFFDGNISLFVVSLAIGMLMHDVGDLLTGGIRGYFWPFVDIDKSVRIARIKVGGVEEWLIVFGINLILLFELYCVAGKVVTL